MKYKLLNFINKILLRGGVRLVGKNFGQEKIVIYPSNPLTNPLEVLNYHTNSSNNVFIAIELP